MDMKPANGLHVFWSGGLPKSLATTNSPLLSNVTQSSLFELGTTALTGDPAVLAAERAVVNDRLWHDAQR
jgi:hypothetical protein